MPSPSPPSRAVIIEVKLLSLWSWVEPSDDARQKARSPSLALSSTLGVLLSIVVKKFSVSLYYSRAGLVEKGGLELGAREARGFTNFVIALPLHRGLKMQVSIDPKP